MVKLITPGEWRRIKKLKTVGAIVKTRSRRPPKKCPDSKVYTVHLKPKNGFTKYYGTFAVKPKKGCKR